MSMVYFAHPIDQADAATSHGMRALRRRLAERFDWVYDPGEAFQGSGSEYDRRIQMVNDEALTLADAVFAVLPLGVGTVGTVREILKAGDLFKTTTVYTPHRPIGLGELPSWVDIWLADPIPANRLDDFRQASEGLWERHQNRQAISSPSQLVMAAPMGTTAERSSAVNTLYYSGPLTAVRKYDGDAAWDVAASETVKLRIGGRARVKTGVFIAPPPDIWVHMVGRSSMFAKGLFVEPGVIDAGWRGELEAKVYNLGNQPVVIEEGERIAQLIPHYIHAQMLQPKEVPVEELPYGDRGTNGWGSTGS